MVKIMFNKLFFKSSSKKLNIRKDSYSESNDDEINSTCSLRLSKEQVNETIGNAIQVTTKKQEEDKKQAIKTIGIHYIIQRELESEKELPSTMKSRICPDAEFDMLPQGN